jgi:hypothetical protein
MKMHIKHQSQKFKKQLVIIFIAAATTATITTTTSTTTTINTHGFSTPLYQLHGNLKMDEIIKQTCTMTRNGLGKKSLQPISKY